MASPRPVPISEEPGSSPPPLSPRSRIEARLALIDTSSDDDEPRPARKKRNSSAPAQEESTASEDSDAQVRPKGRMAARMFAQANRVSAPSNPTSPESR